ncbi:hypothetical protein R2223_003951 [Cronobacter sakazakii]|nr:hypothetical protein [Cronobacter sakazakii]ELQ6043819.1 hypothetical protein [Cronobacter sakazakii]ELQ6086330.1 hypothetical protein [Cronobacter sakazakii]ELQ6091064.1 hypothetical protein [Cronobacter sakazakii]ELQ6201325.1 hypothetical protein [Cronobacter sakazakii]
MKELLHEIREERALEWIEDNYPDAEEGTPEWDFASQNYNWMLDDLAEQAELQWFQDSLNDLDDRYIHAVRELDELKELVASEQAGIVFRMAYAHTVTVMEAFLMYSARALLNDVKHLDRFYSRIAPAFQKKINKCKSEVLNNTQLRPTGEFSIDEADLKRRTAQLFVSQLTFHNLGNLDKYFSSVLELPYEWPFEPLIYIVETRQDLVHRNGVSKFDEQVHIGSWHLESALSNVRAFVDAVALTLRRETGASNSLPVVLPRNSF